MGLSLRQCAPRCRGAPCSLSHRGRIQAYTRRRRHAVPARPPPHLVVVESSGVVPKIDLSAQCAPRPRRAPRDRSHRGVRRGLPEGRTSVAGAEAPTTSTSLIPRCTSWSSSRYGLPEGALASLAPHVSVKATTVGPALGQRSHPEVSRLDPVYRTPHLSNPSQKRTLPRRTLSASATPHVAMGRPAAGRAVSTPVSHPKEKHAVPA